MNFLRAYGYYVSMQELQAQESWSRIQQGLKEKEIMTFRFIRSLLYVRQNFFLLQSHHQQPTTNVLSLLHYQWKILPIYMIQMNRKVYMYVGKILWLVKIVSLENEPLLISILLLLDILYQMLLIYDPMEVHLIHYLSLSVQFSICIGLFVCCLCLYACLFVSLSLFVILRLFTYSSE